jgi:transposase
MSAAIPLRDDYSGGQLRALARASKNANQTRHLLALAVVYDGGKRSDAAEAAGVTLQIVRDWVLRFNDEGPEGLIDRRPPGATPKLNDAQRRALCEIVESGPIPAVHGVVRWRLKDLVQWLWEEFRVSLDESTVSRELKALGFVKISARPRHRAQNELVREDFKKLSPPRWQRSGPGCRPAPR